MSIIVLLLYYFCHHSFFLLIHALLKESYLWHGNIEMFYHLLMYRLVSILKQFSLVLQVQSSNGFQRHELVYVSAPTVPVNIISFIEAFRNNLKE